MKVSVVTPNYNGERFLKTFFESLNNDSEYIGEVIIIDNGSSDNSKAYIDNNNFNFPVKLIENDENYHIVMELCDTDLDELLKFQYRKNNKGFNELQLWMILNLK